VPRQPNLRAFRPFRRALLSARGGLSIPFLDPIPPNEGGARNEHFDCFSAGAQSEEEPELRMHTHTQRFLGAATVFWNGCKVLSHGDFYCLVFIRLLTCR